MRKIFLLLTLCMGCSAIPPQTIGDQNDAPSSTYQSATTPAEPPPEPWQPHGSLSFTLQQRYIGLRVSRVLHDTWMLWTDAVLKLPYGFYLEGWWSYGLDDHDASSNGGDEFDPIVGWQGEFGGLYFHLASVYFNLHPLGQWYHGDVWSQMLAVGKTVPLVEDHSLRLEGVIEWLSEADDFTNGALVLRPNIGHS